MALVRVFHDYSPNSAVNSRPIQAGQIYELVDKTNPEWWLVRENGTADVFFVPSTYVKEISQQRRPPPEVAVRRDKIEETIGMLDAVLGGTDDDEATTRDQNAALATKTSNVNDTSASKQDNLRAAENKQLTNKDANYTTEKKVTTLPRTDPANVKATVRTSSIKEGQRSYASDVSVKPKPLKRDDSLTTRKPALPSPKERAPSPTCGSVGEQRISNGSSSDGLDPTYINSLELNKAEADEEVQPLYANLNELHDTLLKHLPEPKSVSRPADVLPPGWEIHIDQSGRPFYMHKVTGKTSWTLPTDRFSQRRTICVGEKFANTLETVIGVGVANRGILSPSKLVKSSSVSDEADISNKLPSTDVVLAEKRQEAPTLAPTVHPTPPPQLPPGYVAPSPATLARTPSNVSSRLAAERTSKLAAAGSVVVNSPALETAKRATLSSEAPSNKPAPASPQLQEMAQNLNRTKILENGKKCKKNWGVVFVATDGRFLYFYSKQGTPKSGTLPEAVVDLVNAEIKTGAEVEQLSSKKHVISVKTEASSEYLLNADQPDDLMYWVAVLKDNVKALKSMPPDTLPSAGDKTMSLKSHPSLRVNADDETPQKKREVLNAFLPRRKTIKDLKDKNIYKFAPVFGNHLQLLCDREKSLVPKFVIKCISAVEKKGLATTGLYRISGNLADIQSLRFMINKDEKYEKYDDLASKFDVHVLTGALKLFFRELQEPLFTFALFDAFLKTMEERDDKVRSKQEKEIIDRLPSANKETAKVLFKHMANVVAQKAENQMSNHSIAVVFGPTLLWPESMSNLELGTLLMCQGRVVENLMNDVANIF